MADVEDTDNRDDNQDAGFFKYDSEDLCLPRQAATAVYRNTYDQIVVRQENDLGEDDSVIIISKKNLSIFIRKLREVAKG
jgi:hypothetical protein